MEEQWQDLRQDILDLSEGNRMQWVRVKTLMFRAYDRGQTSNAEIGATLEWASQEGFLEVREGPPEFGAVRLTGAD